MTATEIQAKIDKLTTAIESGVVSVSTDGTATTVSLEQMRTERKELRRMLAANRQPTSMTIDLSHG